MIAWIVKKCCDFFFVPMAMKGAMCVCCASTKEANKDIIAKGIIVLNYFSFAFFLLELNREKEETHVIETFFFHGTKWRNQQWKKKITHRMKNISELTEWWVARQDINNAHRLYE